MKLNDHNYKTVHMGLGCWWDFRVLKNFTYVNLCYIKAPTFVCFRQKIVHEWLRYILRKHFFPRKLTCNYQLLRRLLRFSLTYLLRIATLPDFQVEQWPTTLLPSEGFPRDLCHSYILLVFTSHDMFELHYTAVLKISQPFSAWEKF